MDTCTVDGVLEDLWSEAGFFEIEPGVLFSDDSALRARMWYSFWPADADPEKKPLLLIFQGGPYWSMAALWGGNTGPFTLDPARTDGQVIASNPHSWTRFANLLYVDSPFAGYSYLVGPPEDSANTAAAEASAFVRALLRFLARHPMLERAPVVLVGESYGGARATLMLRQLLGHAELEASDAWHHDPELAAEVVQHLRRTRDAQSGDFSPREVAEQFRGVAMIQGVSVADFRPAWSAFRPEEERVPSPDQEQRHATLEADLVARMPALMSAAVDPDVLAILTGVDVASIAWLRASARSGATRNGIFDGRQVDASKLVARFGSLTGGDAYFVGATIVRPTVEHPNGPCGMGDCADGWLEEGADAGFASILRHVGVFMTDARADSALDSTRVLEALPKVSGVAAGELSFDPVRGRSISFTYEDGLVRSVRIPAYENSSHPVAMHEPEQLAEDLRAWLAELVK